tara:strand:+ start:460 stop:1206 length:747 start_codon:yes stop_codon:yes gene_type:complete
MKYVTKYKSPNYNSRNNSQIKLIIIHYTALKNINEAISYLCKKEKKVSSHYLISQKGIVYNLVNDKSRAWHAGVSFWQDITDINSISIGIELDYSPYGRNNKFSYKMISKLKELIIKIQRKYKISKNNILGHSDIAPFRKKDPGKYFPWELLCLSKITLNINKIKENELKIMEAWFYKNNLNTKKKIIILALSLIGYDTRKVHNNNKLYNQLISAYKNRYLNNVVNKEDNFIYSTLIQHLFKLLLTKN